MSIEAMKQALEYLDSPSSKLWPAGTQYNIITALRQAIAKAEKQKPVAWATMLGSYSHVSWGKDRPDYPIRYEVPLYTTPPAAQREWVGLTDEEIDAIYTGVLAVHHEIDSYVFARAIEQAHGIKD